VADHVKDHGSTRDHVHVVVRYEAWTCGPEDGPDGGIAVSEDVLVIDPRGIPRPDAIKDLPWPPVTDGDEAEWNIALVKLVRASVTILGMIPGVGILDARQAREFVERLDAELGQRQPDLDIGRRLN